MPTKISDQVTVTTAGTAVPLGNQQVNGLVIIKALDTNTAIVAIGNDGTNNVSLTTGTRLQQGELFPMDIGNLADVWLNSEVSGEGVSWMKINI